MWNFNQLNDVVTSSFSTMKVDKRLGDWEDMAQETMLYLLKCPDLMNKICEEENKRLLWVVARKVLFRERAKLNGVKRDALSHYNQICKVCEQYGIEKKPENAYKIAGVMGHPFTIVYVKGLLSMMQENNRDSSYDFLEDIEVI